MISRNVSDLHSSGYIYIQYIMTPRKNPSSQGLLPPASITHPKPPRSAKRMMTSPKDFKLSSLLSLFILLARTFVLFVDALPTLDPTVTDSSHAEGNGIEIVETIHAADGSNITFFNHARSEGPERRQSCNDWWYADRGECIDPSHSRAAPTQICEAALRWMADNGSSRANVADGLCIDAPQFNPVPKGKCCITFSGRAGFSQRVISLHAYAWPLFLRCTGNRESRVAARFPQARMEDTTDCSTICISNSQERCT